MAYDELRAYRYQNNEIQGKCNTFFIHSPTLQEIVDYGEGKYWREVFNITSTAFDERLYLYSKKIDYNTVSDFQVFLEMSKDKLLPTNSLILPSIKFDDFEILERKEKTNEDDFVLYNSTTDTVITEQDYNSITDFIRKTNGLHKNATKDGNKETRNWRLKRDLEKLEAEIEMGITHDFKSILQPYISTLTNTEGFKYNWNTVWELPINVFIDSLYRFQIIDRAKSLTNGMYCGNIDVSAIDKSDFNYLKRIEF